MSFSIQIDATQLFYRFFIIPGITPDWIDSRAIQTLDLDPGVYSFQISPGQYADFSFEITPMGKVNYDKQFDSFLSGRDTSTLTVAGLEVTIDAQYLSGPGVLLVCPLTHDDWISKRTVRLVPASFYRVQQGPAVVCELVFAIKLDGTFSYDPSIDLAAGGFLKGNNTNRLEFYGYPILIDSRISINAQSNDPEPARGIIIQPIDTPLATTGVLYVDLLPAKGFRLQNKGGIVSTAIFDLSVNGTFSFAPTLPLTLDTFNGLNRLTTTGPLPS